jgi:hypothetical protein
VLTLLASDTLPELLGAASILVSSVCVSVLVMVTGPFAAFLGVL